MMKKQYTALLTTLLLALGIGNQQAAAQQKAVVKVKKQTLTGRFKSTAGVMTPLSCYCGNGGELTTAKSRVDVCFENTETPVDCKKIKVTGYYTTQKNNPEPNSPCPRGERKVFTVISYKCL